MVDWLNRVKSVALKYDRASFQKQQSSIISTTVALNDCSVSIASVLAVGNHGIRKKKCCKLSAMKNFCEKNESH